MLHIQENINLLPYNTFRFPCIARYVVEINDQHDIQQLISHPIYQHTAQKLILGGGSNMLFSEDTYDGLVIKNNILGKIVVQETNQRVLVELGAGELRNNFVRRSIDNGRTGVENLVSIPGTVGAAPVQNIGAYGVEAKDTIVLVRGVNLQTGDVEEFTHAECQFGYRDSLFKKTLKEQFFITAVQFQLEKYNENRYIGNVNYEGVAERTAEIMNTYDGYTKLRAIATAIAEIRASKLPDLSSMGTAGSFFQNPIISLEHFKTLQQNHPMLKARPVTDDTIKLSAGQLIELVGFKGHTQNNVGVYEHHALVLVHHGDGKGSYLLDIIHLIQQKVQDTFTVQLIPEVNIIRGGM